MKLSYRRTILVGFCFFFICSFWQAYDNLIPKILTDKFGMSQANSGIIMALDNILALFMLPLFGALSDKCKSRLGKRTPFILVGTLCAVTLLIVLTFADAWQLKQLSAVKGLDTPEALAALYDFEYTAPLMTPEGQPFVFAQEAAEGVIAVTREQFMSLTVESPDYAAYAAPARQAYAHAVTSANRGPLIFFIVTLLFLLVSMASFRSPAVALMPDVTIKPLRSKGNAIINLMGSAGGILVLVLGMIFATGSARNALMSYRTFFIIVAVLMLAALSVFLLTVRERKWAQDMRAQSEKYGIEDKEDDGSGDRKLSKEEKRSLIFILASIVLWFMGYNAVTSKYSVYADKVIGRDFNMTLIIAQAAAIVSYLPVGMIASKVGRKKTILAGVFMLTTAFLVASFLRAGSSMLLMNAMFALAGVAWATINVNSFPMVVEMCRGGDVGRYTGIYYTASMAAQTFTPYLSGMLMDKVGMTALFPYATVFTSLAFVTMLFVKHGDSRPEARKGLEALDAD